MSGEGLNERFLPWNPRRSTARTRQRDQPRTGVRAGAAPDADALLGPTNVRNWLDPEPTVGRQSSTLPACRWDCRGMSRTPRISGGAPTEDTELPGRHRCAWPGPDRPGCHPIRPATRCCGAAAAAGKRFFNCADMPSLAGWCPNAPGPRRDAAQSCALAGQVDRYQRYGYTPLAGSPALIWPHSRPRACRAGVSRLAWKVAPRDQPRSSQPQVDEAPSSLATTPAMMSEPPVGRSAL